MCLVFQGKGKFLFIVVSAEPLHWRVLKASACWDPRESVDRLSFTLLHARLYGQSMHSVRLRLHQNSGAKFGLSIWIEPRNTRQGHFEADLIYCRSLCRIRRCQSRQSPSLLKARPRPRRLRSSSRPPATRCRLRPIVTAAAAAAAAAAAGQHGRLRSLSLQWLSAASLRPMWFSGPGTW